MAAGRDEFVAVLVLDALPVTTITMSAWRTVLLWVMRRQLVVSGERSARWYAEGG